MVAFIPRLKSWASCLFDRENPVSGNPSPLASAGFLSSHYLSTFVLGAPFLIQMVPLALHESQAIP